MASVFTYDTATNFGGSFSTANFDSEIRASDITVALSGVAVSGTTVTVTFKADLPQADHTVLDGSTHAAVNDVQEDATLDPGASPSAGDRYLILDSSSLHANFGSISGLQDNDIVEYDGGWSVDYDADASGNTSAYVQDIDSGSFYSWNGTIWSTSSGGGLITAHDSTTVIDPQEISIKDDYINIFPAKRKDAKFYYRFSPDLTDRASWYLDAVKVTGEVPASGVVDGVNRTFTLDCDGDSGATLLVVYGRVCNALALTPHPDQNGGEWGDSYEYLPVFVVDGSVKAMDRPHRAEGDKDYVIDPYNRTVTFHSAPQSSVSFTYWYVPTGATCHILRLYQPPVGKKWTIDYVEAQFSDDIDYTDTIIFGAYPAGIFSVPLEPELHYTSMHEVDDYSIRSVPPIKASGGMTSGNTRGATRDKHLKYWEYLEELSVSSVPVNIGPPFGEVYLELNARLETGIPFGGERATITIRIVEEDIT